MGKDFWEQITPEILQNTGLTKEQFPDILAQQEKTIIDFLSFCCFPENSMEAEIARTKEKILRIYTDEIAKTITKTEVFFHDLSAESVEAIFNLFQLITSAEIDGSISERATTYDKALKFTYLVYHMVQFDLAEQYFKRIKSYNKMIRYYNHSGVLIKDDMTGNNKPFKRIISREMKVLKKDYRKSQRKFRKYFHRPFKIFFEETVQLDAVEEDIGLPSIISRIEHINQLYIESFPRIIGNGYNMSAEYRLLSGILDVSTVAFILYGFLKLFGVWDQIIAALSPLVRG